MRSGRQILLGAALTLLALSAGAQQLRCDGQLLGPGDSVARLLEACGEPDIGNVGVLEFGEWTYNFGPDEFMMRVTIRDGEIERVEQLGYGYVEEERGETM